MPSRRDLTTFALLSGGMALFGSATPLSKLVAQAFPVFTASLLRVLIGALVLLPFALRRAGELRGLQRRDWLAVGGIALVGVFGFTALLLLGMRRVPGVVGAIVMSSAPAVTATASVLLLGEGWTRRKLLAIALAVGGVTLVNAAGAGGDGAPGAALVAGSLLVFGAVCCEASFTVLGKLATQRLTPLVAVFLSSALAIPLFLAPALALEPGALEPGSVPARDWAALVFWGGGTLGLGSLAWYAGLRRAEGSVAAGFMGVMPASALLLSYVLLGEPVRLLHLVGFAVVFVGVLLMSREHAGGAGEHG